MFGSDTATECHCLFQGSNKSDSDSIGDLYLMYGSVNGQIYRATNHEGSASIHFEDCSDEIVSY